MQRTTLLTIVLATIAALWSSANQAGPTGAGTADVSIPYLPAPVPMGPDQVQVFEAVIDHHAASALCEVFVVDANTGSTIVRLDGPDLAARASDQPQSLPANGPRHRTRVFIELYGRDVRSHGALIVKVGIRSPEGAMIVAASQPVPVNEEGVPVLAPPLRRGLWVAVHSPLWPRGHRRVVYGDPGRERIPGRFAVDWVGVDRLGRTSTGKPDVPSDTVGYGAPVLAVADSVVVATRDSIAESKSIARNPAHSIEEASGNFIVLRLSDGRFAIYEHLRPGSVKVRPGEKVATGDELGALGFTGDSTGPHLHFHVAECSSPVACEGVPFAIRGMTQIGRYSDVASIGRRRWAETLPQRRLRAGWPDYDVVVRF